MSGRAELRAVSAGGGAGKKGWDGGRVGKGESTGEVKLMGSGWVMQRFEYSARIERGGAQIIEHKVEINVQGGQAGQLPQKTGTCDEAIGDRIVSWQEQEANILGAKRGETLSEIALWIANKKELRTKRRDGLSAQLGQ